MSIALTKAINTDKVNTGVARQVGSIRSQEPAVMMCPVWGGVDNFGRVVSSTTFAGSTEGCSLPSDRIDVENVQRPQYSSFITLNAAGIRSNGYGEQESAQRAVQRKMQALHQGQDDLYGSAGLGLTGQIREGTYGTYSDALSAPVDTAQRQAHMARVGYKNNTMYALGGMGWNDQPRMASSYPNGYIGVEGYEQKSRYVRALAEQSCYERFKVHKNNGEYVQCLANL